MVRSARFLGLIGIIAAADAAAAHGDPHWQRIAPAVDFQLAARGIIEQVSRDPHFGGFIFRNEPEPYAIVMFTGDAEARLRRYTSDPRYKAKRVGLTLAQLEEMKDEMTAQLARNGFHCWSVDGDEEHNTVTVTMPDPSVLERAIAAGRVRVPAKFRLLQRGCATFR